MANPNITEVDVGEVSVSPFWRNFAVFIFGGALLLALIHCGPAETGTAGAGGSASSASGGAGTEVGGSPTSGSATGGGVTSSGGEGGTGTGSGGTGPWQEGFDNCLLGHSVTKGATPYTGAFQAFRPAGRHVTQIALGVWQSQPGDAKEEGAPWVVRWAVGPDAPVGSVLFPAAPRISEERSLAVDEATFGLDNPHVGIVRWDVDIHLEEGEVLLVLQRLDRPGAPPSNVLVCTDPVDGGLDSYAVKGECPGAGCETVLVPAVEATEVLWVWAVGDSQ